jgi:hypothetical protein
MMENWLTQIEYNLLEWNSYENLAMKQSAKEAGTCLALVKKILCGN